MAAPLPAAALPPPGLDTLWNATVQPLLAPFLAVRESFPVDDAPMRALIDVYKTLAANELGLRAEFERHRASNRPFAERIISVHSPLVAFMQRLQLRIQALITTSKSYECFKTLEKSIYGKVKFGRSLVTNERVAIKLTDIALFESKQHLEDPFAEIQVLRCLSRGNGHRNVVRLVDAFAEEGWQWTVLEFCPGGELFRRVEATGPIPEAESRALLRQILAGLQYIHDSGFVHLDMSLENVMADAQGEMKIIDFGMAHQIPRTRKLPPFAHGIGKLGYRAPEIPYGEFDPVKADIYSVGVMLFMMLTGSNPYKLPEPADARFVLVHSGQVAALLRPNVMSLQAVDLLNRLLGPAGARPSIDQILHHPWMQQH